MLKSFEEFLNEALSLKRSDRGEHFLERIERRIHGLRVVGLKLENSEEVGKLNPKMTREIEYFFRTTLSVLVDPKNSRLFKDTSIGPTNIGLILVARPRVILPDGSQATPVFSVYERSTNEKTVDREGSYFWIVTIGSEVQTILLHPGDGRRPGEIEAIVDRSINHLMSSREAELSRLSRVSGIDFKLRSDIRSAHEIVTRTVDDFFLTLDFTKEANPHAQAEEKVKSFTEKVRSKEPEFSKDDFKVNFDSSKTMTVSDKTWFMEKNAALNVWGARPILTSSLIKGVTGNEIRVTLGYKWLYWLKDKKGNPIPTFNPIKPPAFREIKKGDRVSLAKKLADGSYVINTGIVSEITSDINKKPVVKTERWIYSEIIDPTQAETIFKTKTSEVNESTAFTFDEWKSIKESRSRSQIKTAGDPNSKKGKLLGFKIKSIKSIKGKNKWSRSKNQLIHMVLDIGKYEYLPSNKILGFYGRLKKHIPSLITHRCSKGVPGGFLRRVKEGTWMGHIIEHVALELQTLSGMNTGWGRTRMVKGEKGTYNVVFNYEIKECGRLAAKEAVRVVNDIIEDRDPEIAKTLKRLRSKGGSKVGPNGKTLEHLGFTFNGWQNIKEEKEAAEYDEIAVSNIDPQDFEETVDLLYDTFKKIGATREDILGLEPRINNGISLKATADGKIVGVYLLKENSINNFIDSIEQDKIKDFRREDTRVFLRERLNDNGIQGIALAVLPEYRSTGIPGKMMDLIKRMGYDYIWGVQDKSLENIEYWKKTRKVFAESSINWATYAKL